MSTRIRIRVSCDTFGCHANAWDPARGWSQEGDRDYCAQHTRERASRFICPPEHEHGDSGDCYNRHSCRCDDCREGRAAYQRELRRVHAQQRFGVVGPLERARVDGRGTRRRLQALVARGWSMSQLGEQLGIRATNMPEVLRRDRVRASTRAAVHELYERAWALEPPQSTPWQRRSVAMAKAYAQARGWVPPLAWDDIDTDEEPPAADPIGWDFVDEQVVQLAIAGQRTPMTHAERREVVRRLHREQWGDRRIASVAGMASETVLRIRQELGLPGIDRDAQAA